MELLKKSFCKDTSKKFMVFALIMVICFVFKSMLNLFLLTFLFTYLIYSLQSFLYNSIGKKLNLSDITVTIVMYVILFGLIAIFISKYAPVVIKQIISILDEISNFKISFLYIDSSSDSELQKFIQNIFSETDIKNYLKNGTSILLKFAKNIGNWSFDVSIATVLSMLFMFEKESISNFARRFEKSTIQGIYKYLKYFALNFLNSFGKVIQTQIIIAFANTILSSIMLCFMHFPQILGLGLMIFAFSLIPVAGTIISLIPLSIIAFNIGGITKVLYVLMMIALLHVLESYVLNPKFMSAKTKLPAFVALLVLIASEHFMGIWGLLIGLPLFMSLMDLINVASEKIIDENSEPVEPKLNIETSDGETTLSKVEIEN